MKICKIAVIMLIVSLIILTVWYFLRNRRYERYKPDPDKFKNKYHKFDRKIMIHNLETLDKVLKQYKVPYWLGEGTALGAHRESDIIENDTDIDIGIFKKDYENFYNKCLPALFKNGFWLGRGGEDIKDYSLLSVVRNGNYIDVDITYKGGTCAAAQFLENGDCDTILPFLNTFTTAKINNKSYRVPSVRYLELLYGNWKIPSSNHGVKNGSQYLMLKHLSTISRLSIEKNTPIFPRNGFLLGVVRHKGFLPNENIDIDLACHYSHIDKIISADWGDYEIIPKWVSADDKDWIWDKRMFNGRHPLTGEKFKINEFTIKDKLSNWSCDVDCFYEFDSARFFYPLYTIENSNSENELKLAIQRYNKYDGGNKILHSVDQIINLDKLLANKQYHGKVGTLYDKNWFRTYKLVPFYDVKLYIPIGAIDIVKADYGKNVLEIMIDKDGKETALTDELKKPKRI